MNIRMKSVARTLALQVLRGYKWLISPLFPPACRYVPTCSEYAMQAVERYGVIRGSLVAGWRLLRCHPFAQGGYDPLVKKNGPERREIPYDHAAASSVGKGPLRGAVRPGTV